MSNEHEGEPVDPFDVIRCWCGAEGIVRDMFDDSCLDKTCGGSGELHCYCGGDSCVCHYHGSIECDGCPDCREDSQYYDDFDYGDDYE